MMSIDGGENGDEHAEEAGAANHSAQESEEAKTDPDPKAVVDAAKAALDAVPDESKADVVKTALVAMPNSAKADVAAAVVDAASDANKAGIAVAALGSLPDANKAEVINTTIKGAPDDVGEKVLDQLIPDQKVTNTIWLWIIITFSVVLGGTTLALIAAVFVGFWRKVDMALVQILLTVFTTSAGILAGFISGRASTGKGGVN